MVESCSVLMTVEQTVSCYWVWTMLVWMKAATTLAQMKVMNCSVSKMLVLQCKGITMLH